MIEHPAQIQTRFYRLTRDDASAYLANLMKMLVRIRWTVIHERLSVILVKLVKTIELHVQMGIFYNLPSLLRIID